MTADERLADLEAQMLIEMTSWQTKFDREMTARERLVWQFGFLAGRRHALDEAEENLQKIMGRD